MNPFWKRLTQISAGFVAVTTIANVYEIFFVDEASLSWQVGLSIFILSLFAVAFWVISALVFANQSSLKKWPIFLVFVHPIISVFFFWAVNRRTT